MAAFVRLLAAGGLALAIALTVRPAPSAAQRQAVAPLACTVEPRPDGEVAGLAPGPSEPLPEVAGGLDRGVVGRFQGELADPETAAAVADALAQYAGCLNANDRPRLLALLTDRFAAEVSAAWEARATEEATPAAGSEAPPLLVAARFEGWDAPPLAIASVRAQDVLVLPDGRAVATVGWRIDGGGGAFREGELVVLEPAGDRWLLDYASGGWLVEGEVIIEPPAGAGVTPREDIPNSPGGYGEVDSAVYAEPTLMGAQFTVAATFMVASRAGGEGVGCDFFTIERGERSVTVSATCSAEDAVVDLPAYLSVEAYGPRRSSDESPVGCEDAAPLVARATYACTVDLPEPAP